MAGALGHPHFPLSLHSPSVHTLPIKVLLSLLPSSLCHHPRRVPGRGGGAQSWGPGEPPEGWKRWDLGIKYCSLKARALVACHCPSLSEGGGTPTPFLGHPSSLISPPSGETQTVDFHPAGPQAYTLLLPSIQCKVCVM